MRIAKPVTDLYFRRKYKIRHIKIKAKAGFNAVVEWLKLYEVFRIFRTGLAGKVILNLKAAHDVKPEIFDTVAPEFHLYR